LRAWYETKFSLEFRSLTGTEFQSLFTAVMQRKYPGDFQKVKPWGKQGDKKCDGHQTSQNRIYQVYAPEQMVSADAISKINEDLRGAFLHWRMRSWIFVHNQYRGLPPDVVKRLAFLNRCKTVAVGHWGEIELLNEFLGLATGDQAAIVGSAPTPDSMARLELPEIIPVVTAVSQQEPPLGQQVQTVESGKLEANALSWAVKELLLLGSRKSKLVERFFRQYHDALLGDRIAAAFRVRYETLRGQGLVGDEIFHGLWRFAGVGNHQSVQHENAVLALLAFLFEECEIFEPVPKANEA
jgi:hypothetical protein